MEFKEFCEQIREGIRNYLPEQYQDAEIILQDTVKQADIHLTGLIIRSEGEMVTPCIYLDRFHVEHEDGRSMNSILTDIAQERVQAALPADYDMKDRLLAMVEDYNLAKEHLHIRLCDPKQNQELLERCVHTMEGDFAATYHLMMDEIPNMGAGTVALRREMLMKWEVPLYQLKEDALLCERKRDPQLLSMSDVMTGLGGPFADALPGAGMGNLLLSDTARLEDTMYVLSNKDTIDGASVILQHDIMEKIGRLAEGNYYVLPSSRHEVLIVPERMGISREELSEMVRTVNETQVTPDEFLSNEVQFYDAGKNLLMNAAQYETLQIDRQEMSRTAI